jgi:spore germination protein YaaH
MVMYMQIYLAATPEDAKSAAAYGYPLAHMAYYKSFERHSQSGGWMILSDLLANVTQPRDIIDECKHRGFDGILLDFESGDKQTLLWFARRLDELCAQYKLTLITNKKFQTDKSLTLVSSGAVNGSLKQLLMKYGTNSVLEIVRLSQDIALPAPHGRGITMTRERLGELLHSRKPVTFFSSELLARYFTYKDESGVTHFIIYDDAESISKKLRLAEAMGFYGAIMLYSEVKDLLGNIM